MVILSSSLGEEFVNSTGYCLFKTLDAHLQMLKGNYSQGIKLYQECLKVEYCKDYQKGCMNNMEAVYKQMVRKFPEIEQYKQNWTLIVQHLENNHAVFQLSK